MNAPVFPPIATFSDAEFDKMIAAGVFAGRRVELRDGVIVEMSPIHTLHALTRGAVSRLLRAALEAQSSGLSCEEEISVRFGNGYYPTPDVLIWELRRMRGPVLGPEVRLVVEVADDTLADDLGAKRDLYARAGAPEYWVVDVNAHVIHCFALPQDGRFARAETVRYGEPLTALTMPALTVATGALPVA